MHRKFPEGLLMIWLNFAVVYSIYTINCKCISLCLSPSKFLHLKTGEVRYVLWWQLGAPIGQNPHALNLSIFAQKIIYLWLWRRTKSYLFRLLVTFLRFVSLVFFLLQLKLCAPFKHFKFKRTRAFQISIFTLKVFIRKW